MNGLSINTPFVSTNLAEGAVDTVEPLMPDLTLGSPNEDEGEQVTKPTSPLILPPASETGLMPIVAVVAEGADNTDSQDAVRTTAETQALPSVSV